MRIILLEPVNPDYPALLSRTLKLPLIEPPEHKHPATDLLSDDRIIQNIVDLVTGAKGHFIISRYPHVTTQAQSLDIALSRIGMPVSCVLSVESTKSPQNRENKALIRYYRTQNKLIRLNEALSADQVCEEIHLNYAKRRSNLQR